MKPKSIKEPTQYLRASITKYFIGGDPIAKWAIGSQDYVKKAVWMIRAKVEQKGPTLKPKANSVLLTGFKPKLDGSGYIDADGGSFHIQCIGILQWVVEFGHINMCTEVSMLSAYNPAWRIGHLEAALHIFS